MSPLFARLFAISDALQAGKTLSDPAKWADKAKRSGYLATVLVTVAAAAVAFGYPLMIDGSDCRVLAAGILALGGIAGQIPNLIHVGANPNAEASLIGKLAAFSDFLSAGKTLADPKAWSDRATLIGNWVSAFHATAGLALAYGYSIQVQDSDLGALATAMPVVAGLFNQCGNWLHVASNPIAGHLQGAAGSGSGSAQGSGK